MEIKAWLKLYHQICLELSIDPSKDLQAALLLSELIKNRSLTRRDLHFIHKHSCAVVFGAGPSLDKDLDDFLEEVGLSKVLTVAADGACGAFLERNVKPDIVVTDLDGGDGVLLEAAHAGSLLVVHAHGDNVDRIKQLVPALPNRVLGTTQTEPVGVLDNFGGFTDGDRAVYMCEELGVKNIAIAGMDFEGVAGRHSKPHPLSETEMERKRRKLQIAKRLLTHLAMNSKCSFYNVSSGCSYLEGFTNIKWSELIFELSSTHEIDACR
ncbi:MAG: DUF115 domain-containing protein [Candidatus Caldarchaeum sp.]|nr:DUF115 domain-containing protein [Candidatus Caldarchaeum sp.]